MNPQDKSALGNIEIATTICMWAVILLLGAWFARGFTQSRNHDELMKKLEQIETTCGPVQGE